MAELGDSSCKNKEFKGVPKSEYTLLFAEVSPLLDSLSFFTSLCQFL